MDWITSIKEIQKAQENNQLVIFVGAGVSKNSSVPTWWELIKKIADEIGYNKCDACKKKTEICPQDNCEDRYAFTQDEFLRIPEYYYQQDTSGDKSNYYNLIQSTLRGGTGPNPIDDEIFNILPHHIITTNYDPWLESSNAINSRLYTVVSQDSDLLANASGPGGKFCVSVFRQSQECEREALALRAGPLPYQNPTASCLVCAP